MRWVEVVDGRMGGWEDGRMGGWEDGRMGGWEDIRCLCPFIIAKPYFWSNFSFSSFSAC